MKLPSPENKEKIIKLNGSLNDIISAVNAEIFDTTHHIGDLGTKFEKSHKGLRDLWNFVKKNIKYKEDPDGVQWIKTPLRLWADRVGDCKSFTIFICAILKKMGIPYIVRYASYEKSKSISHVYPVALYNGQEIIMDAVHTTFNEEVKYTYKKDFMSDISRLSGLNNTVPYIYTETNYIPYSELTEGNANLALIRREFELHEQIGIKEGDSKKIALAKKGIDAIHTIQKYRGIHAAGIGLSGVLSPTMMKLALAIKNNATKTGSAMSAERGYNLNYVEVPPVIKKIGATSYNIGVCTTDQRKWDYVKMVRDGRGVPVNDKYLGSYYSNSNFFDRSNTYFIDKQKYEHVAILQSIIGDDLPNDIYETLSCFFWGAMGKKIDAKLRERFVNEYYEKGGLCSTYGFIGNDKIGDNNKVYTKKSSAIDNNGTLSTLGWLSESTTWQIQRNGILAGAGNTPEQIYDKYKNSNGRISLDPVTITIIATAIIAAIEIAQKLAATLGQKPQAQPDINMVASNLKVPKNMAPLVDDFNVSYSDTTGTGSGTNTGTNGTANASTNNTSKLLIGGALALGGIYYFSQK